MIGNTPNIVQCLQTQYDLTEDAAWEYSDVEEDELPNIGKGLNLGAKRHFADV